MFNLDEINIDFNDESFEILNANASTEKGKLSYGVNSNLINDEFILPSKRKCLLVNNSHDNLVTTYPKHYNSGSLDISPTYSPITSTQINSETKSIPLLVDISNILSPNIINEKVLDKSLIDNFDFELLTDYDNNNYDKLRKFPGPAGNLSEYNSKDSLSKSSQQSIQKLNTISKSNNSLAQINQNEMETLILKRAYNFLDKNCLEFFQNYNLNNVFKMLAKPNGMKNSKIPVICLILSDIEYLPMDASANMKDKTGSIKCAIHRQVLEKYNEKIKTGSVFILKKVSVFSPLGRKYYLNITQSNIIDIISPDNDDISIAQLKINKKDIEKIIEECLETQEFISDSKYLAEEHNIKASIQSYNDHNKYMYPSTSNCQGKELVETGIDVFDDDMDELLMSIME